MDVTTYFLNRTLALEAEIKALRANHGAAAELAVLKKRLAEVSEDLLATKDALRVAQREAARAAAPAAPPSNTPPAPACAPKAAAPRQATDDEVKRALLSLLAGAPACAPQ